MSYDEFIRSIAEQYPEYMTQKEMIAALGICKSKVQAIQRRGEIPFEFVSTASGRRQRIRTIDILRYQYKQISFLASDNEYSDVLRSYFEIRLRNYPQMLFISDVQRFTGYAKTTVNNWVERKLLKALCYNNQRISSQSFGKRTLIPKDSLVAFLISPYYRSIYRKSILHKEQSRDCERLFVTLLNKWGCS